MKVLSVILIFIPFSLLGQNVSEKILNTMKDIPISINDLSFSYVGIDTVDGIEIQYLDKFDDKCDAHLFFISDTSESILQKNISIGQYLCNVGSDYHYMMYQNYSWFFGCEYNDVDSFNICNNTPLYSNAINVDMQNAYYYSVNKREFFYVARVKAIVYKFYSTDMQYARFFYHINDCFSSNDSKSFIEKIIYKQVISREYIILNSLLLGKPFKGIVDCKSVYD